MDLWYIMTALEFDWDVLLFNIVIQLHVLQGN